MDALFNVVRLQGKAVILAAKALPLDKAKLRCERLQRNTGLAYELRPYIANTDWHGREEARFADGTYTKLPWHNEAWVAAVPECKHHYPHVSRQDPANMVFTADDRRGELDVKTPIRPVRYLNQFYGLVLNEALVRSWVATYKAAHEPKTELRITQDAHEIVHVYMNGPDSCMKRAFGVHPVTAYAGPDLGVAYVERKNKIVARGVVWPKKHIYGRIYGDIHLMEALLEDADYKPGDFTGARLRKIQVGNRYACPFIDNHHRVLIGKNYLVIEHPKARHSCRNQDGFCGVAITCQFCHGIFGRGKNEGGVAYLNGQVICPACLADRSNTVHECAWLRLHYRRTEGPNPAPRFFNAERIIQMGHGDWWHRDYARDNRYAFLCRDCNHYWPNAMRRLNGKCPECDRQTDLIELLKEEEHHDAS